MTITEAQKELDDLYIQMAVIHDKHCGYSSSMGSYAYFCYQEETKLLRERTAKLYSAIIRAKDTIQIEI